MSAVPAPRVRDDRWSALRALRQLHPPVVMIVQASVDDCLRVLATAARPSLDRLHLREVFQDGRRYYVKPTPEGFRLTSDAREAYGSRRRRTRVATILLGTLTLSGNEQRPLTIIQLRARMNILYALAGFLIPAFVTSIIAFLPWQPSMILLLSGGMFALSWLGFRMNAALQAAEMIYFVQRALEDLPAGDLPRLPTSTRDTVRLDPLHVNFWEEWEKFYKEQSDHTA